MAARPVRPRSQRGIAGACAALASRFGLLGVGEIAYIALWILIPEEP